MRLCLITGLPAHARQACQSGSCVLAFIIILSAMKHLIIVGM